MYMASFSLGPARIIKIKTAVTKPQVLSYFYFVIPVHTRIKYVLEGKKKS